MKHHVIGYFLQHYFPYVRIDDYHGPWQLTKYIEILKVEDNRHLGKDMWESMTPMDLDKIYTNIKSES